MQNFPFNTHFFMGCKLKECPPTAKYQCNDGQEPKIETVANMTPLF